MSKTKITFKNSVVAPSHEESPFFIAFSKVSELGMSAEHFDNLERIEEAAKKQQIHLMEVHKKLLKSYAKINDKGEIVQIRGEAQFDEGKREIFMEEYGKLLNMEFDFEAEQIEVSAKSTVLKYWEYSILKPLIKIVK